MKQLSIISISLFLFLTLSALQGESMLSSLEEIAAYGAGHNLEYKSSQVGVLTAADNRTSILLLEDSSITTEGTYNDANNSDVNNGDSSSWGLTSKLTVPVLEQLSLSGSIDEELNSQVGLILSPLAHSDSHIQSEISYDSTLVIAESARISAENDTLSAALNWMVSTRDLEVLQRSAELKDIIYNDDKVRYDLGEITLDDLQDSLISWSESRIELSEAQKNFHIAESSLYSELGTGAGDITVKSLDMESVENSLDSIKKSFVRELGDPLKSDAYLLALLNVNSAEANLDNIWIYDPELKAEAGFVFNQDEKSDPININASISFTLALDDFQKNKRDIAKEELQIKISEAQQSRFEAELEFEQIIDSIDSTEINSEISRLEYEQAQILLSEAELLQKLGETSQIELEESRLTVNSSENALFRALADEYLAWTELKKYF